MMQPTGMQPTGTQPAGTQLAGTQPAGTLATMPGSRPADRSAEAARAFRRAAIELHHRSVDAALNTFVDRRALDRELVALTGDRYVVAVSLHPGPHVPAVSHGALLVQALRRVRSIVREPAGVHQVGDLDLAVVVVSDHLGADTVARRIARAFQRPFSVGADEMLIEVGVGLSRVDPDRPLEAVVSADLAARRPTN